MSRYAPGYKGPMTTAGPSVPRRQPTIPAPVGGSTPFLDSTVSPRRPPVNPTPVVGGQVRPRPTGPMTPVLGGGKAPASVAPMMMKKKGGAVKKMAAGGSASKRADGCAQRGKTKGKIV